MGNCNQGDRVVRTYQDSSCGTGDYCIVTESGAHWKKSVSSPGAPLTGEVRGQLRDGRVYR